LQTLLAGALTRLARTTGSTRCVAWAVSDDDRPYTLATMTSGTEAPPDPDPAALEAIWRLPGATDLGEQGLAPELGALTRRQAFAAAVPLCSAAGERLAALLVGGCPDDPPGNVRPRTLATLNEAAEQLRTPAGAARSVSRLERLDHEVAHLDRRASLGDLLSEIVHELRNPLVSMKTLIQLLPERRDDPEFYLDFRNLVADELSRMERLLETLLHHAGPATGTDDLPGECQVAAVVDSIARLLEHRGIKRGVCFGLDIGPSLPPAAIAEDALRQILLNLALNALEATPEGGTVSLGARERRDRDGSWVELTIDDAGPGVAPEARAHLFEPFYSSREGRAGGLGLAISQRLARQVGGAIAVEDAPTGGARFRLQLPGLGASVSRRGRDASNAPTRGATDSRGS
jgi:two-component system sensor histidine kinase HydH